MLLELLLLENVVRTNVVRTNVVRTINTRVKGVGATVMRTNVVGALVMAPISNNLFPLLLFQFHFVLN
jgi:hypothetical protein